MSYLRTRSLMGGGHPNFMQTNSSNYLIEDSSSGTLVLVGSTNNQDLVIWRSQDGGLTWVIEHEINIGGTLHVAVWYDGWSNIADDTVHIVYSESDADDIEYVPYDISANTLGTNSVILAGTSASPDQGRMSITVAENGDIYVTGYIDDATEGGDWKSSNGGSTWNALTFAILAEAGADDYGVLVPTLGSTNTSDCAYFYYDHSAFEVSVKYFNNITGNQTETIITSVGELPQQDDPIFGRVISVALDLTNDLVYAFFWNDERDVATADLLCYEVDFSGGTSSVTARTNVITNAAIGGGNVFATIDNTNGDLYVMYQASENEVSGSYGTGDYYWKRSTDGGVTWSQEYGEIVAIFSAELIVPALMYTTWNDWKIKPAIGFTQTGENIFLHASEIYRKGDIYGVAF